MPNALTPPPYARKFVQVLDTWKTLLVAKAERERRAGRLAEAATAYAEAFELEQNTASSGTWAKLGAGVGQGCKRWV